MNFLIAAGLLTGSFALLMLVQTLLLLAHGQSPALPFRYKNDRRPSLRYPMKVMVHLIWVFMIVGYPWGLGETVSGFFGRAFPRPIPWLSMTMLASGTMLAFLIILLLGGLSSGLVFGLCRSRRATARKVFNRLVIALPVATIEELVFRGVILHSLLTSLRATPMGTISSVVISSAVFSSVHFVKRRNESEGLVQPAIGLFFVGILLGTAYVATGGQLWVPIAIHAIGILGVEVSRLFLLSYNPRFRLLIGGTTTPHAGIPGIMLMLALTALTLMLHS